jgi:hypothetical protein
MNVMKNTMMAVGLFLLAGCNQPSVATASTQPDPDVSKASPQKGLLGIDMSKPAHLPLCTDPHAMRGSVNIDFDPKAPCFARSSDGTRSLIIIFPHAQLPGFVRDNQVSVKVDKEGKIDYMSVDLKDDDVEVSKAKSSLLAKFHVYDGYPDNRDEPFWSWTYSDYYLYVSFVGDYKFINMESRARFDKQVKDLEAKDKAGN